MLYKLGLQQGCPDFDGDVIVVHEPNEHFVVDRPLYDLNSTDVSLGQNARRLISHYNVSHLLQILARFHPDVSRYKLLPVSALNQGQDVRKRKGVCEFGSVLQIYLFDFMGLYDSRVNLFD